MAGMEFCRRPLLDLKFLFMAVLMARGAASILSAQTSAGAPAEEEATVDLAEIVLVEDRVANKTPAATFSAPVSFLRFEPQVDLQTRNFGEAQGDIAIRGGIFEGTAVQIEGMTIYDPQTGHYAAELPVPMDMLSLPAIRTGSAHAFTAMQASVGSVAYAWKPIESGGEATFAVGNGRLNRQSIYAAHVVSEVDARRVAVDAGWSRSEARGTIANGDHRFERVAGRVQIRSETSQTEVFAGYQDKFFGWPNLYTPFGWPETEHLQTTLLAVNHRRELGGGSLEAGLNYRRNRDDYEADRRQPGRFNPYLHETDVTGGFLHYRTGIGGWRVEARAEGSADALDSTALNFGKFMSRSYWKLGVVANRSIDTGKGALTTRVGATWDDTNRDSGDVSPLLGLSWAPAATFAGATPRLFVDYSEATRVPGYTALNANAVAGLFRGNPDLRRERSRNVELGGELRATSWSARAVLFHREDDPLTDWTLTAEAPNARTANAVAIRTTGVELLASKSWSSLDVVAGYAWLHKDATYRQPDVVASFYALNFPIHRATLAVIARLGAGVELRCDNEYRLQEENLLRTVGGDDAFFTSIGLHWTVPSREAIELSLVVDNLWQDDFQELPAVPAPGRQVTFGVAYRW